MLCMIDYFGDKKVMDFDGAFLGKKENFSDKDYLGLWKIKNNL